ncbi:hypothetical protein R3P38DRAFT_3253973 [Favolaschia claudopus]|uniref:SAM domain-containing protein n=1 Tax=Favolaschia claudopus TaxID=2862362 RepID=A0AAW0DXA9_9AGAR
MFMGHFVRHRHDLSKPSPTALTFGQEERREVAIHPVHGSLRSASVWPFKTVTYRAHLCVEGTGESRGTSNSWVTSFSIDAGPDYDGDGVRVVGGIGEGEGAPKLLHVNSADLPRIEKMSTADFCAEYQLDDDIRERLEDEGFVNMISLFYLSQDEFRRIGFNTESLVKIQAALNHRLADKHPDIMVTTPRITNAPNAPRISGPGGVGGAGGHRDARGGVGGTGKGGLYDKNEILAALGVRIRGAMKDNVDEIEVMQKVLAIQGGRAGAPRQISEESAQHSSDSAAEPEDQENDSDVPANSGHALPFTINYMSIGSMRGGIGGGGGQGGCDGGNGGTGAGPQLPISRVEKLNIQVIGSKQL